MWLTIGDHAIDKHGDHQLLTIFVPITFSQLFEYCIMYMCNRELHWETCQWLHHGHALDTVWDLAPCAKYSRPLLVEVMELGCVPDRGL